MGMLRVISFGLLGRKKPSRQGRPTATTKGRGRDDGPFVKVSFTDFHRPPAPGATGYAYRWTLPSTPQPGLRVWVPGMDGLAPGVVLRVTKTPGYSGEIKNVARVATEAEIAKAVREAQQAEDKRIAAWRAKRGSSTGGSAASDPAELQRLRSNPAALVRGRHYTEWVEPIKQMKRDGAHVEAVHLLRECQAATMRSDQGCPAPWYFEQEAIICRKDKHFDAELAVLQLYLDACVKDPHPKMVERMAGAQALAARRKAGAEAGKQLQAEADQLGEDNQDGGGVE